MHPLAIEASISSAETAAANRWLALWPAALLLVLSAWILPLHAASITVNTATDDFGAVSSNCSLREAIQSANNNADFGGCVSSGIYNPVITDVINLPQLGAGGFFTLTRIGTDDNNASGDLDINGNVRIEGFSATNSVIRGDTTDPDSDRHRLMQVMAGTVTLNDLALQNGLEDGATAGGGLRTEPGSTTILNRVTVAFNTAAGNAGGILNRGTMTINASLISQNKTTSAANGGGGIFNSAGATLTINDSRILSNTVDGGAESFGGGIYSGGTLNLDNTVVDGNLADGRQAVGDVLASGGGIHSVGDLTAVQSTISNNQTVTGNGVSRGGGIHVEGGNATQSSATAPQMKTSVA
jgi:CSLREA domain-containing protein